MKKKQVEHGNADSEALDEQVKPEMELPEILLAVNNWLNPAALRQDCCQETIAPLAEHLILLQL